MNLKSSQLRTNHSPAFPWSEYGPDASTISIPLVRAGHTAPDPAHPAAAPLALALDFQWMQRHCRSDCVILQQWLSIFLMLRPFKFRMLQCGDPVTKFFSLLFHNCSFTIVVIPNVDIWYAGCLTYNPHKRVIQPLEGAATHRLRSTLF